MKEFLKKYKTQIINVITIFLILEFAIYPGLTTANTVSNILAGIGLLLLIVWGGLALYQYVTSDKRGIVDKEELKEAAEMVDTKQKKCGCGRSESGFCTGLHRIPMKDWEAGVREIPKPKTKKTK